MSSAPSPPTAGRAATLRRIVQNDHPAATSSGRRDTVLSAVVLLVFVGMAYYSVREYIAPDYKVEIVPVFTAFDADGLSAAFGKLPGYPAAAIIEFVLGRLAMLFGADEANAWRFLSIFGLGVLAGMVTWAARMARATDLPRGAIWVAAAITIGSPTVYWALRIGHPEEVLATALLLGSVLAAARERPLLAGLLLGLACAKAWPIAAAIPVIGLLLSDLRRTAIAIVAATAAIVALYLPSVLYASDSVQSLTDLGTHSIFNVGQVFWFFGDPIPASTVATQVVPQPRVGPVWSGEISHPLIVGVGFALGLVWCWTLVGRLRASRSVAALRIDGRTRSDAEATSLAGAALLVMAGILFARCLLDTWNVPYYLMPALVLGTFGEVLTGRRPLIALVATGIMWQWCAPGDLTVRSSPDVYTAQYLGWAVPVGIAYLVMGFRSAREALGERAPVSEQTPLEAASPRKHLPTG